MSNFGPKNLFYISRKSLKSFLHEEFKLEIHCQKVRKLQEETELAQPNFPAVDFLS